jgi:hypothetical protein
MFVIYVDSLYKTRVGGSDGDASVRRTGAWSSDHEGADDATSRSLVYDEDPELVSLGR